MTEFDPPRLSDPAGGAPESLRRLFGEAERDLPSSAELARLRAKLGPLLDQPPVAGPPTEAAATAPRGTLAKVAAAVVAGGAVVGGLWLGLSPKSADEQPAPSVRAPEPAPVATTSQVPAPTVAEPPAQPPADAPSVEAEPSAAKDAAPPPRSAPPRPSGLTEDQLLEQARSALGSNPSRALSLAQKHQVDFPRGALSQEREVIAIEALRRLGRTEEAARRTERFERRYPKSAHQRKLEGPKPGP